MNKEELERLTDIDFPDAEITDESLRKYFESARRGARVPMRHARRRIWIPTEYEEYRERVLSMRIS